MSDDRRLFPSTSTLSTSSTWCDNVPTEHLRHTCRTMGYKAKTWTRSELINACNLLKDAGNVTDEVMNTVCMNADKMSVRDAMTVAIWQCATPQTPDNDDRYNGMHEQCYSGTENTCPTGSTFTRESVDSEGKRLYCCESNPVEVTAEVMLNASGTPTQDQFNAIIDSSQASEKEKAKEKQRYSTEMGTLMSMLKAMEKQGKLKNNEAYELLMALQTVKKEFSDQIAKLTDNITEYFGGGSTESENVRVMQEKIREKGVVMRMFDVIWQNVVWLTKSVASLFGRGVSALARHYVYMLVYHPATLRFFIYTAMELKAEFCARFGMIHRIPKQTVWEKLRAIPASTLRRLNNATAWTLASIQVFLEETMAYRQLETIIAFIMDPVYNLAVLPAIGVIFGASGAATAVIYGMLQFGGKIAGNAFGRMLEAQMWKYNTISSLIETHNWFFDWRMCTRIVETEEEMPVPCPKAPWSMCYPSEIAEYKMKVGTLATDRGVAYAPRAPKKSFYPPANTLPDMDDDVYFTPPMPGRTGRTPPELNVVNPYIPFSPFPPPPDDNSDSDEND